MLHATLQGTWDKGRFLLGADTIVAHVDDVALTAILQVHLTGATNGGVLWLMSQGWSSFGVWLRAFSHDATQSTTQTAIRGIVASGVWGIEGTCEQTVTIPFLSPSFESQFN
jgi:hypothetical protein